MSGEVVHSYSFHLKLQILTNVALLIFSWQRITIAEIRKDEWFLKDYSPVQLIDYEHVNLDDVYAAFDDPEVGFSWHLANSLSPICLLLSIEYKACVSRVTVVLIIMRLFFCLHSE